MLPLWRKTKSESAATIPFWSGQEVRRMAEFFMGLSFAFGADLSG
jgi:hypothetical protein